VTLEGKSIIVTGASRGIGRELALAAGARGAQLVLAARSVTPRRTLPGTLGETVQAIEAAGGTAVGVACDVTNPEDLERLVDAAIDAFGKLDGVVNNAADMAGGDLDDIIGSMVGEASATRDHDQDRWGFNSWLRQFATNVHAPYLLMRLAVPHLRTAGSGVIINVTSSVADMVGVDRSTGTPGTGQVNPAALGYATTKAALNRMTNAAALDLVDHRIAVIAVDPGTTRTEAVDVLADRGFVEASQWGPIDIPVATIIELLESDDPLKHTGQVVRARD
jgi:NAD(P)-dependent dehydrogenase (short-subunit alcohol dehydrogenase family)